MRTIIHAATALLALVSAISASPARAQDYPSRPIKIVVPFPPGGGIDLLVRAMAIELSGKWGHPIVIDNRGGASGNIGAEIVAKSAADGYTLLMVASGPIVINPGLYPKLGYDPLRDLTPIAFVAASPLMLVVHPSVAANNLRELIALAKAKSGGLAYGTSGIGTSGHLAMELFKRMAGVDMIHVPYKSMAPAMTDILGGQVHMGMPTINVTVQHVRSGRLRVNPTTVVVWATAFSAASSSSVAPASSSSKVFSSVEPI